jgi:predicted metal-dependent hydrolase
MATKALEIRERIWDLDGEVLPYRLERRRGRRRVTLQFDPELGLCVQTPRRLPLREVDRVLREEAEWIRRQLAEHRRWREAHPPRRYVAGEALPLLGESWQLALHEIPGRRRVTVRRERRGDAPGRIHLFLPAGLGETERIDASRRSLERWYQRLARGLIEARLARWAPTVGVTVNRITLRDMKTRWGSSGSNGNLSFNWKIVMAPPAVVDYLVVHELCHLVHADHSPAFWRLVESHLPDSRWRRAWLKREGRNLYL